jgi:hypothetical protein
VKKNLWPLLALVAVLGGTAIQLHRQGRLWISASGRITLWVGNAWSSETSQQLLDPYTFTHVLHGFAFCALVYLILPKLSTAWRLWVAVTLEALWELFENTNFIINRYRDATAALGYTGDTVVNSLGDIVACAAGFLLAWRLGLRRSIVVFAAVEVVLLIWIRDSLLLEVLMLIYPVDFIKAWQMRR